MKRYFAKAKSKEESYRESNFFFQSRRKNVMDEGVKTVAQ